MHINAVGAQAAAGRFAAIRRFLLHSRGRTFIE